MGSETDVRITITDISEDEFNKIIKSANKPENVTYDPESKRVFINAHVWTENRSVNLKAFKAGFCNTLEKVLGVAKAVFTEEI